MAEFEDNFDKEIAKLTEEQIDNYYKKGITDGLSDEQRAYLYFKDQAEAYAEVMDMGDDIDKLDFDGPDITLNPDGSTTERTPNMILNENVPKEDFKLMFGGNPYEKPLPEIFNDIKGTAPYEQTQFHLHSMNLEYQDRKKV